MKKRNVSALGRQERNESPYSEATAKYLLRRMRGRSRSVLALADDDHYYVIKFAGNPKGGNSLANEVLGYQLAEALRFDIPEPHLIAVNPWLIRYAPSEWFEPFDSGPPPGVHFTTRFLGEARCGSSIDFYPRARLPFLMNRADLLGMLVFDVWTNKRGLRQVVFTRNETFRYRANFIDFGDSFGGPENVFCNDDFDAFFYDIDFYEPFSDFKVFDFWIARIRNVAPKILGMPYEQLPGSWYTQRHVEMRSILLDRLSHLEDLVYPVAERLRAMKRTHAEVY